jgi:hypothetical protein
LIDLRSSIRTHETFSSRSLPAKRKKRKEEEKGQKERKKEEVDRVSEWNALGDEKYKV